MNFTRESIFISALRGFFKTFAVIIGIAVAVFVIMLGLNAVSNQVEVPNKSEMKVSADTNWSRKLLPSTTPVILRINIQGVIGMGKMKEDKFKTLLLDSREGVLANDRVKGIILHVNTPGGSASDSSAIYNLLKEYKKRYKTPVIAYVDGICASGGMYISSAADEIFASEDSIVGSVGVRLGPTFNFSEAMTKVGVKSLTLTEGKDKDALNPFRPWKEGEDTALKDIIAASYKQFVKAVTDSRKDLDREKLITEYGANVFIAGKAKELGYIDNGKARYDDALTAVVKASGIKEDEKYQVIEMEPYQSIFSELADSQNALFKGKLEHIFPTGAHTTTELSGKLLYLYQP